MSGLCYRPPGFGDAYPQLPGPLHRLVAHGQTLAPRPGCNASQGPGGGIPRRQRPHLTTDSRDTRGVGSRGSRRQSGLASAAPRDPRHRLQAHMVTGSITGNTAFSARPQVADAVRILPLRTPAADLRRQQSAQNTASARTASAVARASVEIDPGSADAADAVRAEAAVLSDCSGVNQPQVFVTVGCPNCVATCGRPKTLCCP